jgi:hypothetical protein
MERLALDEVTECRSSRLLRRALGSPSPVPRSRRRRSRSGIWAAGTGIGLEGVVISVHVWGCVPSAGPAAELKEEQEKETKAAGAPDEMRTAKTASDEAAAEDLVWHADDSGWYSITREEQTAWLAQLEAEKAETDNVIAEAEKAETDNVKEEDKEAEKARTEMVRRAFMPGPAGAQARLAYKAQLAAWRTVALCRALRPTADHFLKVV